MNIYFPIKNSINFRKFVYYQKKRLNYLIFTIILIKLKMILLNLTSNLNENERGNIKLIQKKCKEAAKLIKDIRNL